MASQHYQPLVKTSTLFFKPIHSKSLPDKLMIPRKFVNKYRDVLSDTVILKLPNGEEWRVNLGRRNNGDIWFENGWREFAEYHSLLKGRLLVFGNDDSNPHRLSVLILDLTTSEEIEYPSNHGVQGKQQGEFARETRKIDRNLKRGHCVETTMYSQDTDLWHTSKKSKVSQPVRFNSKVLKVKGEEYNKGNIAIALERAKAFKSQSQDPCFIIVARPSYINASSKVAIPSEFAIKFLSSRKSGQITNLRTSNRTRVWVSKFASRKRGTGPIFELSRCGWKEFAKDNDLKVDDVCVFELIKGAIHHELNFLVSIFRNKNPSDAHLSQETGKHTQKNKRVKIKTEAHEFEYSPKKPKFTKATSSREAVVHSSNSENPFFKATIGLSHGQAIPATFVRKYWKQGKHVVKLQVRDRSWKVMLIRYCGSNSQDHGFFSGGWPAFVKENDLQGGDDCFFELVHRDHIHVMKVSIFKHSSP